MYSRPPDNAGSDGPWLVDACTAEIQAHQLIFMLILCPVLGYWFPAMMFAVALSVAESAWGSTAHHEPLITVWKDSILLAGYLVPVLAIGAGIWRERHRLRAQDSAAGPGLALLSRQGPLILGAVAQVWNQLGANAGRTVPRVICLPNFQIVAHAYDEHGNQAIEISAGLARRIVQSDPLALSILRHEVAHLVHSDLPAICRQSQAAAAAELSITVALAICLGAAAIITALIDIQFPMTVTAVNLLHVHIAIGLATLIVVLPLLLGRYVVRRYASFIIALIEMRADVSAGVWGDGASALAIQLQNDPTVREASVREIGLAYISPMMSHFPADERVALLKSPQRLTTPKLRYFGVAIGVIWLLVSTRARRDGTLCSLLEWSHCCKA